MSLSVLMGWLPAVILPVSTYLQLAKVIKARSAHGVSLPAWFFFGIANTGACLFGFGPDPSPLRIVQVCMAFALPALMDYVLVVLLYIYGDKERGGKNTR